MAIRTSHPEATIPAEGHSTDETEALASYRSLSVLAVLALLLGLAAPLAFTAMLMWVIPVLGIAVALLALSKIAASDGQMVGRGLALAGLAFSVLCLAGVVSRDWMTSYLVGRQAQPVGREFIRLLVDDRPEQAFEMTGGEGQPPAAQAQFGGPLSDASPLESFVADPLVRRLLDLDSEAEVHFHDQTASIELDAYRHVVEQRYEVHYDDQDVGPTTMLVTLGLERRRIRGQSEPQWRVRQYQGGTTP